MGSKYVKKLAITQEQVQSVTNEDINFLFGDLQDMLANGKCCEGTYELLRKYILHPERFDKSKARVSLNQYSNRVQYYKRLEQSRKWAKEVPVDFTQVDLGAYAHKSTCSDTEAVEKKIVFEQLMNEFEAQAPIFLEKILLAALKQDTYCLGALKALCKNDKVAECLFKELLNYPMAQYLEKKLDN